MVTCPICGKQFKPVKGSTYCSIECYNEARIIGGSVRPGVVQLIKDFKELKSFIQVGNKYNVSDNAVRKWCSLYGLPIKTKEIKDLLSKIEIKE